MGTSFGEHRMGTSIMAVSYTGDGGGVVLGADSRTSTGSYIANRASDKITPICDNVCVCRSGSVADTQALASLVCHYIRQHKLEIGENPEVSTVAKLFNMIECNNGDDDDVCKRGLESRTKSGMRRKKHNRTNAYAAVFLEIDYQEDEGTFDEEVIADAYFMYSDQCQVSAQIIGKQDEIEANRSMKT